MADDIPHIILCSDELTPEYKEEIALLEGVTPTWATPAFRLLGIKITETSQKHLREKIEEREFVDAVVRERKSGPLQSRLGDTQTLTLEPNFDLRDEIQRGVEKEGLDQIISYGRFGDTDAKVNQNNTLAVIDTGIDQRNPRITNLAGRINFTDEDIYDVLGHGTTTAVMLNMCYGNIDLFDMKVAGKAGFRESSIIAALAASLEKDITAISMSLGFNDPIRDEDCPLCRAVNIVVEEWGIPVTVSAGNHGTPMYPNPEPTCPARAESAIAVGAADKNGQPEEFSAQSDVHLQHEWSATYFDEDN